MTFPALILGTPAIVDAILSAPKVANANEAPAAPAPAPVAAPARAFEVGKIYATRSICDWDCIYRFLVTKRTATSVWVVACNHEGKPWNEDPVTRRSIKVWSGVETIKPHGTYSMSATLSADKGNIA